MRPQTRQRNHRVGCVAGQRGSKARWDVSGNGHRVVAVAAWDDDAEQLIEKEP